MNQTTKGGLGLWLLAAAVYAGGGPQNVLVVVNEQDADSLELGQYYREKRGIPERNVCRINLPSPAQNLSPSAFERSVRNPILFHLQQEKLTDQIDYLVLCLNAPTRVNEIESITAALFYGFKNAPPSPPCQLPTNTLSFYYRAERAFSHALAGDGTNRYLTMVLTGPTPEDARRVADRGVAADGTAPAGTFYLVKPPGDPDRNLRYKLFDEFDFHARFAEDFPRRVFSEENALLGLPDVLGYMTGRPGHGDVFWTTNRYLPGALADHLTSVAGHLPVPLHGQDSLLRWIGAGATASYGTVNEPCSILEKFPTPMVFFWYARGFNLAESYWMSVAHPYQGLFVGEPLAAPYARPPAVTVSRPDAGAAVSGIVTVRVSAAGTAERPCGAIDFYVDDLFVTTVTNVQPQAWNEIRAQVEDRLYLYILEERDDLFSAVEGLAREIRRHNPMLNAVPYGDRLLLMDGRIGKPGASTPCRVRVEKGLGPEPTLGARALTPTFLEGLYPARKYLPLQGTAAAGDAVECRITLAPPFGGTGYALTVTTRVEAAAGEGSFEVAQRLADRIHQDPALQTTNGVRVTNLRGRGDRAEFALEARKPGPEGIAILLHYLVLPAEPGKGLGPPAAYEGRLGDTIDLLSPRAVFQFWCGRETLSAEYTWDTTSYPDGPHTLRLVAREGTAVQTQGHALVPVIVSNRAWSCRLTGVEPGQVIKAGARLKLGVDLAAAIGPLRAVDYFVEGKRVTRAEKTPFAAVVETARYRGGKVSVQALATDAKGHRAISAPVEIVIPR